ncbi:hypothetical protein HPB49_003028 [Dermacentor silvarum]|uniref:Uncharacterized protein n=1 Tax=Dermacentor silvarum TaxID=543639 RepID=A0ACB8DM60_DERSI|nr:hypothetical protein HPB49_003028 [Dermacentor silvarum]
MAESEVLTALRQQVQQLQQELQTQQQQHSRNASTTEAVPAGSAEDVTAPTEGIPHAASYDTWRVAIKLPPFPVDSPEVWFAQVEAQFSLARITQDQTRYDYVVAHLDARYANELSEEQKIRQLQSAELSKRKPSQLLHRMRALASNMQVQDSFPRALSLQRLPPNVQAILQGQVRLPLNKLAEIADRVIDSSLSQLSPTIQSLHAVSTTIDRQLTSMQQRLGERLLMQQRRHLQSRDLNTTSSRQPAEIAELKQIIAKQNAQILEQNAQIKGLMSKIDQLVAKADQGTANDKAEKNAAAPTVEEQKRLTYGETIILAAMKRMEDRLNTLETKHEKYAARVAAIEIRMKPTLLKKERMSRIKKTISMRKERLDTAANEGFDAK